MKPVLKVSDNDKALESVNFGLCTCRPTDWCYAHCYARGRTAEDGVQLGSSGNSGPITWPTQQAMYEANVAGVKLLHKQGRKALAAAAAKIAKTQRRRRRRNIRWNGGVDLFPEVLALICHLASFFILVWGFSRKAELIEQLACMCDEWGIAKRPHFIGSIDSTTSLEDCEALARATEHLNGVATLAYATAQAGAAGIREVNEHPYHEDFLVVFGYHTNNKHTVLGHPKECPTTSEEVEERGYCHKCRRCINGKR